VATDKGLNKNPNNMVIPQACIQLTSRTLSKAPTRQLFHNIQTGQEKHRPKMTCSAIMLEIIKILSIGVFLIKKLYFTI